jgi:signal transduction histidine kinase
VLSDEFLDDAEKYCTGIDLKKYYQKIDVFNELRDIDQWEISEEELKHNLATLGDFSAEFAFTISPTNNDVEKFLYKHYTLPHKSLKGVILYRNAFSISSYEGTKDWLGFGKRSRISPAAATHPTGSWRVRENQIAGKVEIDKKRNSVLQDLSNRQGLDENIYYELFIEIVLIGIKEFERYRQNIIRHINEKNRENSLDEEKESSISKKIVLNPSSATTLTKEDAVQLASEIKAYQKANKEAQRERDNVETRYKYDVRILNVLATVGLKASSIAHEMRNDRNFIAENIDNIIDALKEFGMWDELILPERTEKSYQNVPYLLESNKEISTKVLAFMNTMLSEIEKKQFEASMQSIYDIIQHIKKNWEDDYAWISISINMDKGICYLISEDYLQVILDNLILNSIQQNENLNHIDISISVFLSGNMLLFAYSDNGKGLDKKYLDHPRKILEVHETTRKKGHGLGMWIVNNTVTMSGGERSKIDGTNGFSIEFTIGGSQ